MAKLGFRSGPYKNIAAILNSLGFKTTKGKDYELFLKGSYEIKEGKHKGDSIAFFHAPRKYLKQYGWTTENDNEKWINIPLDDKWETFSHFQLFGSVKSVVQRFNKLRIDKRKIAVFMREKGKYYFFGIYKSELSNEKAGICIYYRTTEILDTDEWGI